MGRSEKLLFKASALFPFDLFPDEIVIDLSKIDIIYRDILGSYSTHSIPVGDIVDVSVEAIPFFATLKVIDKRYMESEEFAIRFLKREDANKAKKIIQVLISAKEEGVDLSKVIDEELIKKLEELGDMETKM